MQEPKIFFLDIDGTLLKTKQKELSLDDKHSIKKALKKDKYVVLATGRSVEEVMFVHEQIETSNGKSDFIISSNGSYIFNTKTKEIIYETYLEEKDFREIINYAYDNGYAIKTAGKKTFYVKDNILGKLISKFSQREISHNKDEIEYTSETAKKIGIITTWRKKAVNKITKDLQEKFPNLEIVVSGPGLYIEINKKNVSKATAAKIILDKLNIDFNDSVAIGDSLNDYELFKKVGISVAMKNAMKPLKKIATHKTAHVKKSGVSKAIDSLIS